MNRETSNRIRFLIEEVLPPIIRDSAAFRTIGAVYGAHIDALAAFRKRAPLLAPTEYESLYREHPCVHDDTDNSAGMYKRGSCSLAQTTGCRHHRDPRRNSSVMPFQHPRSGYARNPLRHPKYYC